MNFIRFVGNDFIENRAKLIECLNMGRITKKEFLEENYRMCQRMKPHSIEACKCFTDALYRYEYYNANAKYYIMRLAEIPKTKRQRTRIIALENKIKNFYKEKDRAILLMMSFCGESEISAYYIITSSKELEGVLYEIEFHNREKVILHSKCENIKKELIKRGIFSLEKKESLISDYINSTY